MGSFSIVLTLFAVVYLIGSTDAATGSCPLASKINGCSPKCYQNSDCSNGKMCCSNACNTKSCVDLAVYGGGNNGKDKYSQSGPGSYCNNQKCNSFEVCKLDPTTKRMKCMRA